MIFLVPPNSLTVVVSRFSFSSLFSKNFIIGNYGRKKIKITKQENGAASKIQARQRGKKARREQIEQDNAALKIQARIRGKQSRGSKEKEEKVAAAKKIQARARGRKARAMKAREQAAIAKIQAIERGRQTRKGVKSLNVKSTGVDTTMQIDEGKIGYYQNSDRDQVRDYIFPSDNTMVADTGMQTQLLPPDAPPREPAVVIQMNDVLDTYNKGIVSIFKAYTSKNGMNRTGHKATFDDIKNKNKTIDRAAFTQIATHFKLMAPRNKKRLNSKGERILPNAEGWYRLWSLLPSSEKEAGWDIARDIRKFKKKKEKV